MDPFNSSNGFKSANRPSMAEFSNQKHGNVQRFEITDPDQMLANGHSFQDQNTGGAHLLENQPISTSFTGIEDYDHDDCEFSDGVLKYIDQILLEEDMEDKTHMLQESLDFQAKERSFYEVLGQKYPPSPDNNNYYLNNYLNSMTSSTSDGTRYLSDVVDPSWRNTSTDCDFYRTNHIFSNPSISSSNYLASVMDRLSDPPSQIIGKYNESEVVWSFQKGVDDANKFLSIGSNMLSVDKKNEGNIKNSHLEARGEKNPHADFGENERSKKLLAVYTESNNVPMEEFDDALLYTRGDPEKKLEAYMTDIVNAGSKNTLQAKGSSHKSKGRRYKYQIKKEVVDLRSLLIDCAQSIAADDRRTSNELLRQIRDHSSPFGDGEQRLAHYFADGLEARLAGTGSEMQKSLLVKRITASDYLRAYYTYIASSPFVKISNFVSSKLIFYKSEKEKAVRVHIIDFGILYGFQWPTYIQRLAELEGGPLKLRITGIDFPQPGFRPAERVEETGRRLARYAKTFNVPFEFNAIAQNWESIKIEDLKLEKGEFLAVNCLYRAENLPDKTGVGESPRSMVFDLIRKINPDYFIHGVISAAYGVPFFVTRFREALFHYSALYDMLEATIPRDKPERAMLERDIFGKEALNVIACEDWESVGRAETYKQWRKRHLRAGFVQVPFDRELRDSAMYKVKKFYHREFIVDEDDKWLLMAWKGRVMYAISCLQPV